ncbi:helix-turn-helix domain-containing protein [Dehalogenimonas sp. THU2]|uniref:MerR family transcriptional regulator n=1 Tax=Dehalogenimonas sp. THU2 TaxID=3151121 RepID=UPI0032182E7D
MKNEDGQINGQLINIREASELLNVSINTLRRWGDKGKIDCWRISSRGDRRFRREDIERMAWKSFASSADGVSS